MSPLRARERGLDEHGHLPARQPGAGGLGHQEHGDRPDAWSTPTASIARPARPASSPREHAAIAAIKGTGPERIQPGDVLVLICRGPIGAGMEEIYQITSALKHLSLRQAGRGADRRALLRRLHRRLHRPRRARGAGRRADRQAARRRPHPDRHRPHCGWRAASTWSAPTAGRSAAEEGARVLAARGPRAGPGARPGAARTTRGSGPRCSTRAAAPGAAASTTWTRS